MPVFEESGRHRLALVRELIIDPETGRLLAFLVGRERIVVPSDIERFGRTIVIQDHDRIIPISDVLRVWEVQKLGIAVIGSRVVGERSKIVLGRVMDYELDCESFRLHALVVAKPFLFFRFQAKLISSKSIVRISKNRIIVKDIKEATVKGEVPARSQAFAA